MHLSGEAASFIGEKARKLGKRKKYAQSLKLAKEMEKDGVDGEEIYKKTGWFRVKAAGDKWTSWIPVDDAMRRKRADAGMWRTVARMMDNIRKLEGKEKETHYVPVPLRLLIPRTRDNFQILSFLPKYFRPLWIHRAER